MSALLPPAAVEAVGFAAAAATIAAQSMRRMIPLRALMILGNALFIAYGALAGVWPTLALALVLLPLNAIRLVGMRRLVARVRGAAGGGFDPGWLEPFGERARFAAGTTLFRQGDPADRAYWLLRGAVRYVETGRVVGAGHFVGDMAVFAPDGARSYTSACVEDVEALVVPHDRLRELFFQNPRFGFYLARLIVTHLRAHVRALERTSEGARPSG